MKDQLFDVRRNNKSKTFVADLMQGKVKPFQASFIPGDEPLKYIELQTFKQEAVQKRFYQKVLYKQQEKFPQALSHLIETNKLCHTSSDDIDS